jgi:hypothetical protein
VRISLATSTGLADVEDDGHVTWRCKGDARVVAGEWAIVDDQVRCSDERVIRVDSTPLCVTPTATGAVIGTAGARVFSVDDDAVGASPVESFDRIPNRDEWYTPWGAPPDTRSLTVDRSGTLFVNVHVGGVWRRDGEDWAEVVERDNDTHQVLAADDTIVVAAAVGFGQSDDGGRSFRWTADGLHDTYCRAVTVADRFALVTASGGPRSREGAIYRRPLDADDTPFAKCHDGLPEWFGGNIDTFQLAAHGSTVALASPDGSLFLSADAGATWDRLIDGLGEIRALAVT